MKSIFMSVLEVPNRWAARVFAFATSTSRFLGAAFVSSERRRRLDMPAISSTVVRNIGLRSPLMAY